MPADCLHFLDVDSSIHLFYLDHLCGDKFILHMFTQDSFIRNAEQSFVQNEDNELNYT